MSRADNGRIDKMSNLINKSQDNKSDSTSMHWGMIVNQEKKKYKDITPLTINNIPALIENNDDEEDNIDIDPAEQQKEGGSKEGSSKISKMSSLQLPNLYNDNKSKSHVSDHSKKKNSLSDSDDVLSSLMKNNNKKSISNPKQDEKPIKKEEVKQEKREESERNSKKKDAPAEDKRRRSENSSSSEKCEPSKSKDVPKKEPREKSPDEWTPAELRLKKLEIFVLLQELESFGIKLTDKYTLDSDYAEMKQEYDIHNTMREKRNTLETWEDMFTTGVSGIEVANEKMSPYPLKLTGYSAEVQHKIKKYREIFSDFYEKHKEKGGKLSPELRFIFLFFGGAFGFHVTQSTKEQENDQDEKMRQMVDEQVKLQLQNYLKNYPLQPPQPSQAPVQKLHTVSMPVRKPPVQTPIQLPPQFPQPPIQPSFPSPPQNKSYPPLLSYPPIQPQPFFQPPPVYHKNVPLQFQYPVHPPLRPNIPINNHPINNFPINNPPINNPPVNNKNNSRVSDRLSDVSPESKNKSGSKYDSPSSDKRDRNSQSSSERHSKKKKKRNSEERLSSKSNSSKRKNKSLFIETETN